MVFGFKLQRVCFYIFNDSGAIYIPDRHAFQLLF